VPQFFPSTSITVSAQRLQTVWKVLRWVFLFVFVFLAFESIYYFAPDLNIKQLRWLAPGAMSGVVLWLLVSFLFGPYLNFYNNYSVVYGSLGGGHHSDAVVLLDWCDDSYRRRG
jgi:membrane protein